MNKSDFLWHIFLIELRLLGVAIVIKGTTTGTITDYDGKLTFPDVPENSVLVFSFVGMKMQEMIPLQNQNS